MCPTFNAPSPHSGLLLGRLRLVVPWARAFADLGAAAFGEGFGRAFVGAVSYTFMGGTMLIFHLTATLSLRASGVGSDCLVASSAVVFAVMLPCAQIRTLHALSPLAVVGVISIIAPLSLSLAELLSLPEDKAALLLEGSQAGGAVAVAWGTPLISKLVALMSIVFAFSGQVEFVELMAEMRDVHDFPKAVAGTTAVMFACYSVTGAIGYAFLGAGVESPFTAQLPAEGQSGALTHASNFVIFCHVVVAYTILTNVVCGAVVRALRPALGETWAGEAAAASAKGRALWATVTTAAMLCSFVLSNAVPFLADLMAVISAVCALATTYVFPAVFALLLLNDGNGSMSALEQRGCKALVVVALVLSVLGVYAALADIAGQMGQQSRSAFSC